MQYLSSGSEKGKGIAFGVSVVRLCIYLFIRVGKITFHFEFTSQRKVAFNPTL